MAQLGNVQSIQPVLDDINKNVSKIGEREDKIVALESDIMIKIEVLIINAITEVKNEGKELV